MKSCLLYFILLYTTFGFAQQTAKVNFKTCNAHIGFDVPNKKVMGTVQYTFEVLDKTDTIYIDARNMQFTDVKINGKKKGWIASANHLKLFKGYKKGKNTVEFTYSAQPKQTLYFVGEGDGLQIWTQGQGKYTSHWLPSFDDMNEKVIFKFQVDFDKNFTVIANGQHESQVNKEENSFKTESYGMEKPMSSYLVMLAIGKFKKTIQHSESVTKLECYIRPEDADKLEPTYRYTTQMFDFFEQEIGVPYPWGVYRQVPVLDFLYAGMENTTSTIFSQDFVVDSIGFNDRTYINVNAHELAHQWFGDMVTAKSGKHHWLQEGFATYYALLAEKDLFGEDHFNYELYQMAERLQQVAKTDTIPILNEKASSLTFYQKGAWALHVLREGTGHEAFRTAVKNYLEKYAYKNVDTDEFLAEINKVSDFDTKNFKETWLEKGGFEVGEAIALLKNNKFMQLYFSIGELADKRFAEKEPIFRQILESDMFYAVKEEALFQTAAVPFQEKAELIRIAMNSGNLRLRQAVARTVTTIPPDFYEEYLTLLQDESYITREIALNVLCSRFPDKQSQYLDIADGWVGFNDKNLRILWLTLAYTAPGYRTENKDSFYKELQEYASSEYESTARQNAMANLLYIGKPDPVLLQNLVNATVHHKWQFVKFGRDSIRKLLKAEGYREQFTAVLPQLNEKEKASLERLLDE